MKQDGDEHVVGEERTVVAQAVAFLHGVHPVIGEEDALPARFTSAVRRRRSRSMNWRVQFNYVSRFVFA